MSAPVIFSSPSALQEPFKGPNTERETHTYNHAHNTHALYSADSHTFAAHSQMATFANAFTEQEQAGIFFNKL